MEEVEKIEEKKEEKFEAKLLDLKRVAHTRAGGKKLRFRAVMVVGK
jgi:ribosomal protein S5